MLFIFLFITILLLMFKIDYLILQIRLKNIKFNKGEIVYHPLTNSEVIIERIATQQELIKEYPSLQYRPYIGYWVRPIISKFFKSERILLAESSLTK